MNDTAVIICNYNKKAYVKKCVESLQNQTKKDFDIFVVDNASTDGSAEEIRSTFGDAVTLICNNENLGGSGGFNTGMKEAMNKGYRYLVLLDNDVVLKNDCIEQFYDGMEDDPDIGMLGARIMIMDMPDTIQEYGSMVDYDNLNFRLLHAWEKDDYTFPEIVECDYVPACAMIIRRKVIERIGFMPEENFVYYDDISWGSRCKRSGFKVAAKANAVVWHKGGISVNPTTFGNYYMVRNKTVFFMTNRDKAPVANGGEGTKELAKKILREVFEGIYACHYNNLQKIGRTNFDAFLDAVTGVRGKALPQRIRQKENSRDRLKELLVGVNKILIYTYGLEIQTRQIVKDIQHIANTENWKYVIELISDKAMQEKNIMGYEIHDKPWEDPSEYDLILHICDHIFNLKVDHVDRIWIDGRANILTNDEQLTMCNNFESNFEVFESCFIERVIEKIGELTEQEASRYGV